MFKSLTSPALRSQAPNAILKRNLVSSVLLSSTRQLYESKKVVELKNDLKSRGLSSRGSKNELIFRLIQNDSDKAGSTRINQHDPVPTSRSKSTLASLRSDSKTASSASSHVSDSIPESSETTAKVVAEAGKPLGSLKESETPANLEAGTVHVAAAEGLECPETAKSSPSPVVEDPDKETSPPGLPLQKAPSPPITFNVKIPYYPDPPQPGAYIPLVTSYTNPQISNNSSLTQDGSTLHPKVIKVSAAAIFDGEGVSHNADMSSLEGESVSSRRGIISQILAELQGTSQVQVPSSVEAAKEAFESVTSHAKSSLDQAADSFTLGSAASSSSSGLSSVRSANRPLNSEEKKGAWTLFGIVAGGFLLGGLLEPSRHHSEKSNHVEKNDGAESRVSVSVSQPASSTASSPSSHVQPSGSSIVTPEGSKVKAPIMCVPKGTSVSTPEAASVPTAFSVATLKEMARLSTCEVSDALIKLKLPHGGYLPGIEMYSPGYLDNETRICGPAFTVKMVHQNDSKAVKPPQHFVDAAQANSVMVIAAPSNVRSAVWGGLMTARAQYIGVKAVVLDGRCRDLGEHREAKFAVFARGHSTLGQSPFTRPSELQVPITISDPSMATAVESIANGPKFASVTIHPGDIVLGDVDGVVVVPQQLVGKVIEIAQKSRAQDAKCLEDLKRGKGVQETFGKHRTK